MIRSIRNFLYLFRKHWKDNWRNLIGEFFKALGVIWLPISISLSYFPQTPEFIPWWILALISIFWMLWRWRPVYMIKHKLKDRDISIEIRIGDIFDVKGSDVKGSLVVSTNSTFETRLDTSLDGTIAPDSLQGQCTKKYYDDEEHLDHDLEKALAAQGQKMIDDDGEKKRYPIGTVVKIKPKDQTLYFVVIAKINENKVAYSSQEWVVKSLGKLWHFIGEQGDVEPIFVPILGTGKGRITTTREEMIRQIIDSFVAACSEKRFCKKLTIVISENDYLEHEIDLQELGRYLRHYCQYMSLKSKEDVGAGNAVPS